MQILQTIPQNTLALTGAVWNGTNFFDTRGGGQPIHPFTDIRTKQGSVRWPQFAPPRVNSTAVALNARRSINTGDVELYMQCEVAGTTAASAPIINYSQIGTTVVDGTVTWRVRGLHAFKGFANWPARTNELTYSEQFDNAVWIKDSATITPNALAAPNGTVTADLLVATTRMYWFDNSGVLGSKVQSIFVKQQSGTSITISAAGNQTVVGGAVVAVDLITGAITSGHTAPNVVVSPVNGFWRIAILASVAGASGNSTYWQIGATPGIYIWGAQLEVGSFASPYIPTTTATVTRAATNLTLPTAGNIRANDFGVDAWVIPGASGQVAGLCGIYNDANAETSIVTSATTITARKRLAGVNNDATAAYTHSAGTPVRVQVYFSSTGFGVRAMPIGGNWTAWATNATATAITLPATQQIGGVNTGNHFAGNYPATRFVLHSDPKAELERLAAIDDLWVTGGI